MATAPYDGSYDLGIPIHQPDEVWNEWYRTLSGGSYVEERQYICHQYTDDHQYYCTLAKGHYGGHVAHGSYVLARWGLEPHLTLTEGL